MPFWLPETYRADTLLHVYKRQGVGLAVALFLMVYLHFEFSFDKHFKDGERIYRVLSVWNEGKEVTNYPINFGILAPTLMKEVPEVETASRL